MLPLVRMFSSCLLVIVLLVVPHACPVHACAQLASAPHSQWKVETQQGVSWLLTPCGERFWSIGVNVLNGGYPSRIHKGHLAYHWGTFYPTLETWVAATLQRLAAWGFNTAGGWSLLPSQLPLPFIANLELGRQSLFVWSDPFRPKLGQDMRYASAEIKGSCFEPKICLGDVMKSSKVAKLNGRKVWSISSK
jgi:hypothetical protein